MGRGASVRSLSIIGGSALCAVACLPEYADPKAPSDATVAADIAPTLDVAPFDRGPDTAAQPPADASTPDAANEAAVPEGFVRIPPGNFLMGSPPDEWKRNIDERQHRVTITRAFAMKVTEVTQNEWVRVMGTRPARFTSCGSDCPVEQVTWNDAVDYCNARSRAEGLDPCYTPGRALTGLDCRGYRLPTEAEWEYAARAGTTGAFYNGEMTQFGCLLDPHLDAIGWYCGNADAPYREADRGLGSHPTARKPPNAWGLHDMHGNVYEFVHDFYDPGYGRDAADATDPLGPAGGEAHIIRGGSWNTKAEGSRAAARYWEPNWYPSVGFRVVRTL
jgi:formylglycine-generating enzyme required for sulfatase activity